MFAIRALFGAPTPQTSQTLADFSAKLAGDDVALSRYAGKGFEVLAFPCNQFGGQEPGSSDAVREFAKSKGAEFPVFDKIDVNGPNAHPLYVWLKASKGELLGSDIKWNFAKFLLNKEGKVVERYAPTTSPNSIAKDVQALL